MVSSDSPAFTDELPWFVTARGLKYHPLWQLVPWLEPFYTPYEKNYNAAEHFKLIKLNLWFPFVLIAIYLIFIYVGPKMMAKRVPFDLKTALGAWNLFLSGFSAIGSFRIVSHLIYLFLPISMGGAGFTVRDTLCLHGSMGGAGFTVRDTLCLHPEGVYADNATGLWAFLFTTSKCIELIDTVFVVLRKKQLIFLHWYHHVSVLLCAWVGHHAESPALYYMGMNYTIHAVMYLYFWATAYKKVPKWFKPWWITILQISQMFVGSWVVLATTYYKYFDKSCEKCDVADHALLLLGLMYGSYLFLFVQFFVERFITKKLKKPTATTTKAAPSAADDALATIEKVKAQ